MDTKIPNELVALLSLTTHTIRVVYYIEGVDSNANGNPDGTGPRVTKSGEALITASCIKRVIRDYAAVQFKRKLYFQRGADLDEVQATIASNEEDALKLWDTPVFGAMLTAMAKKDKGEKGEKPEKGKGKKQPTGMLGRSGNGRLRGAFQFGIARTEENVAVTLMTGTRVCTQGSEDGEDKGNMHNTSIIEYAVWKGVATYNPNQGTDLGVTPQHLAEVFEGLIYGWEQSRAAWRGGVNLRGMAVFSVPPTASELAMATQNRVKLHASTEAKWDTHAEPITIDTKGLDAQGIQAISWIDGKVTVLHG